ncbi:MAG: putative membrane protein [Crocinitomicaceae bacterium]|jgi:putative membrane protein
MISNFFKGMAMGAADIVPGVSGGTVALLTGIYERLINGIKSVGLDTLITLKEKGVKAAWIQMDGTFLISILLGAATSILIFAQFIHLLLDNYPIPTWSCFFGLVLACVFHVGQQVNKWDAIRLILLIVGTVFVGAISMAAPTEVEITPLVLFLTGALAICAMILPGISGSFILLLIGVYGQIIAAIKGLDVAVLSIFAAGCLVGIMAFSRVLSWVFEHYRNSLLALLTGFMIGALVKVWPWKAVLSYRLNSKGESVPFIDTPIAPWNHDSPELVISIAVFLVGFVGVLWLDSRAKKQRATNK